MSNIFYFTSGIIVGIYLDQKYDLPLVAVTIDNFKEYLKKIEKDDK